MCVDTKIFQPWQLVFAARPICCLSLIIHTDNFCKNNRHLVQNSYYCCDIYCNFTLITTFSSSNIKCPFPRSGHMCGPVQACVLGSKVRLATSDGIKLKMLILFYIWLLWISYHESATGALIILMHHYQQEDKEKIKMRQ